MADLAVIATVVVALVAVNALFVAAEFAIVAAPRPAVTAKARSGDRGARAVAQTLADARRQDRYIATAQVGITIASLGLGMYGEHALAVWLEPRMGIAGYWGTHGAALVASVALLTYIHIAAGEMVPKALALQHPVRTAMALSRPMRWSQLFFLPLVVSLNAAGNGLLRLIGVRRELGASRFHSPEDLRFVVAESHASGKLRDEESQLLQEALDFSEADAKQVMVPRVAVTGIPTGADPAMMGRIVRSSSHTRFPAYVGTLDHIVGVVHVKDILRLVTAGQSLGPSDVRDVPFVPAPTPLADVLAGMRRRGAHLAVVMDEFGGTAGILTIEDLLEEIVGEIDEEPLAKPDPGPGKLVRGTLRLSELGEALGRPFHHPDAETVSGLVLAVLGRPPVQGDTVEHEGLRLEVVRVVARGVHTCRVTVPG